MIGDAVERDAIGLLDLYHLDQLLEDAADTGTLLVARHVTLDELRECRSKHLVLPRIEHVGVESEIRLVHALLASMKC